jgi:hypothetical protein
MQASHTGAGLDLAAITRACKFAEVRSLEALADVDVARALIHTGRGPIFMQAHVDWAQAPRVLPIRDGHDIKLRFMRALAKVG